MDQSTRTNIVAAAVTAAGPVSNYADNSAWQAAVHENAINIAVLSDEDSRIAKSIASIANAKKFVGTIVAVKKEQSSTRGVITMHTGTDRTREGVPEGCEQVRTDRTDSNALGLAMAKKMKSLIGHRVLVWVEVEEYNGGSGKVRVVKHVESLGPDREAEAKMTAAGLA